LSVATAVIAPLDLDLSDENLKNVKWDVKGLNWFLLLGSLHRWTNQ
jgi:hypothetical protein